MRASTNIPLKTRQTITLDNFKGVDFSSSPLMVASNRASDMKNFINEYGVNRKRNGWNEIIRIKDNGVDLRINGIFNYNNLGTKKTIVHAGTKFYELILQNEEYSVIDITNTCTYSEAALQLNRIKDQRSQCFIQDGRMFIIGCGDFLVYGTWDNGQSYQLRRVFNNEDTYIPTTTISIDSDDVVDNTRDTLEAVNMLTNKRINKVVGIDAETITFTLDSTIDTNSVVKITLESLVEEIATEREISNTGSDKTLLYEEEVVVGSIDFEKSKITLNINTKPVIADRDNISITYSHANSEYENRICNCNFGVLFGTNGSSNRLFLSGNENLPNYDFYSEVEDFTYFVDTSYAKLGSSAYAIKGYSRLSDSALAIFKEDNNQEATVYFRTGIDQDVYDSNGNLIQITTLFPTTAGSIGEGVASRFATANLSGDVLILSPNGVYGIVLGDNVSTTERYAKERSRYINERLKQHPNLSEAVGITFKNRYYLSLDNVCYVADARFSSVEEGDMGDTFNYEWWFWDNMPVRVWGVLNETLIFGTATGQICIFDNQFCDRSYYHTNEGQLSLNIINNGITYANTLNIDIAENDRITFKTNIFELVLDDFSPSDNDYPHPSSVLLSRIYVEERFLGNFYNGMEVQALDVGDSGLEINKIYIITDMDAGTCSFALKDQEDNPVYMYGGFKLARNLKGNELYITEVDDTMFKVKYLYNTKPIRLVAYSNNHNALASIILRKNVVAEWYSAASDLGTNMQSKTLLKIAVSTDPSTNGALEFGYETRNLDRMHKARGMQTFSFDNMDFNNFTFETAFANSYTKRVLARNFNYIMFKFKSDNDKNCIINNLTIVYKINKNHKGVK